MGAAGDVANDRDLVRRTSVAVGNFELGGTAPTSATLGTTPTVPGLLFDATAELVRISFDSPPQWDADNDGDIDLILNGWLNVAETNNDTWDMTMDYIAMTAGSVGGPLKASTQITAQTTVTTANGLAQGDMYQMTFTLSAADATNPLTSSVIQVVMEIHLSNTLQVGEIVLSSADINYKGLY